MTTYLGKSCSFCLPRVPFVNCRQFMYLVMSLLVLRAFRKLSSIYVFSYFPFGFEGRIWDLIVSVPDHCLSFYSETLEQQTSNINFQHFMTLSLMYSCRTMES